MSTQTLLDAAATLSFVLVDQLQVLNVGQPVTEGARVTRSLTPVGEPIDGLVQSTVLENAIESNTSSTWSIKVAQGTELTAGQAVRVLRCSQEPSLVGKVLLIDKISQNGLALIRKGVASDFMKVDQQGKAGL
jgi:hypothetical protein